MFDMNMIELMIIFRLQTTQRFLAVCFFRVALDQYKQRLLQIVAYENDS